MGLSTGLPVLDEILGGVLPGDNIVWEVDAIEEAYLPFVEPFCKKALRSGKPLIYFRFASHPPLISDASGAMVKELDPSQGFEAFLREVHRVIEKSGKGAFYVFDSLSDLVVDWYSDQMLANFFMLTCPYLYDLQTVTYFALIRNCHSAYATSPIMETTQLFLSVYRSQGQLYIRPMRVLHRYSTSMYMLHAWKDSTFVPVTDSSITSEILSSAPWPRLKSGGPHLSIWSRIFAEAHSAYEQWQNGSGSEKEVNGYKHRLMRMAISRHERMLDLCQKYFDLGDILEIGDRIIGTGLIGGKTGGMLLARAILKQKSERWGSLLEKHDSFFIASDVFYTYLVRNGCWWSRELQRNSDTFLKCASETRRQILRGSFPDAMVKQIADMLDYYGQSPIIVRSSSLLEDSFGHAFAGKYESIFCANQGPGSKRMEDFLAAVRTIYASAMSDDALQYRAQRGLLDRDEQMALLVQRVSGSMNGDLFYPQLAGVGFSFNSYVWNKDIDPEAGVVRLVFGLGTRAVDRHDDDYTRLIALNVPEKRVEARLDRIAEYSQHKVDVLDLRANQLVSDDFSNVIERSGNFKAEKFATRDLEAERRAREAGLGNLSSWVLTLDGVVSNSPLVKDLREMLSILRQAYDYHVDVEFVANILPDDSCRINLVQCRPLQAQGGSTIPSLPDDAIGGECLVKAQGAVIGTSRLSHVDRLIYVVPSIYAHLPDRKRYSIARLIGKITRLKMPQEKSEIMLIGPGRWGTSTPSLGVPVSYAEINGVSSVFEIVTMLDNLTPDVSMGTHFLLDLVEMNVLYTALFPSELDNFVNGSFLEEAPNKLAGLLPHTPAEFVEAVKVIDVEDLAKGPLKLYANTLEQKAVCFFSDC